MARGFGATFGVGSTDAVATGLSTNITQRSWFCWINVNGSGGGAFGRIIDQSLNTAKGVWCYVEGLTDISIQAKFSTTAGQWTLPIPASGTWAALGISYDSSATTNVPVAWLSGTKQTVTTAQPPVGTFVSCAGEPMYIGNRADGTRNWDGKIADPAAWDTLLTDAEFSALSKGIRPDRIRPKLFAGYWPLDGIQSPEPDLSGNARNGTLTGTAKVNGPPVNLFTPRRNQQIIPGTVVPTVTPFIFTPAVIP